MFALISTSYYKHIVSTAMFDNIFLMYKNGSALWYQE